MKLKADTGERDNPGKHSRAQVVFELPRASAKQQRRRFLREIVSLQETPEVGGSHGFFREPQHAISRHVDLVGLSPRQSGAAVYAVNAGKQCGIVPKRAVELERIDQRREIDAIGPALARTFTPGDADDATSAVDASDIPDPGKFHAGADDITLAHCTLSTCPRGAFGFLTPTTSPAPLSSLSL